MRHARIGIIGLGVGERHLQAYQKLVGRCEVIAVCDLDPTRLAEVGERYGIGRRHTDYRQITESPDIDIVSICSHDNAHAEQCISAFRNGKHVFVEKPLALSRKDAQAVLHAQQQSGRFLSSNFILRESPRFKELKTRIDSGELGEIFCIEGDYLHDILSKITDGWRGRMDFYCVTYGGGIHLIDLMRWLLGHEIASVSGMGSKILTRNTRYRYEDTIINLFKFEDGAVGKCLTTFGPKRPKFHSLTVYGTKKTFVNDLPHARMFDGDGRESGRMVITPYPGVEKGDLIPEFIAAIHENREPKISARDVFRVMDVCFAAWEAVRKGRTVRVTYLI